MQSIIPELGFNLGKKRLGTGKVSTPGRSHEVRNHQSVHRAGRIGAWKVVNDDSFAFITQQIPNGTALTKRSVDGELAFRGFVQHATEIKGSLEVTDGELHGEGIRAIFLDGPVTASLRRSSVKG